MVCLYIGFIMVLLELIMVCLCYRKVKVQHPFFVSTEFVLIHFDWKSAVIWYCKRSGPVAWKIGSAAFLISSSVYFSFLLPSFLSKVRTRKLEHLPERQRNFSTSKLESMLVHEPAGRILIRPFWPWEITYIQPRTAAGREAGGRQASGYFIWLSIDLFLIISHFKSQGFFYLLRK